MRPDGTENKFSAYKQFHKVSFTMEGNEKAVEIMKGFFESLGHGVRLLKKEDKVVVGVSGGADSVCLLFVLLELQKKIPFELIVVHVNHGLRGVDADADDRLIRVVQRDIVERGRTVEAVMERYQRVLKPMHEQFIETCKRYADVIIPQGGHNNAAINMLVKFIKQELKEKK